MTVISTQSTSDEVFSKEHEGKIFRFLKFTIQNKERELIEVKVQRNTLLVEIDDIQSEVQYAKMLLKVCLKRRKAIK